MDVHLPGESGIACTARLKQELPTVQVIMLTVYRNQELIFQALQAGACGYLLKRSNPEELLKNYCGFSHGARALAILAEEAPDRPPAPPR